MLDDRPYMRRESFYRQQRPLTHTLLWILGGIFIVQQLFFGSSDPWIVRYFYLSWDSLKEGMIWQFLTFQFFHANLLHILLNGLIIYFFGMALEEALGRKEMLKLYLGSGVLGGVVQIGFQLMAQGTQAEEMAGVPILGASAGALGLIAAFACLFPERRLTLLLFFVIPVTLKARTLLWVSIGLAVFGLVGPFQDNVAHGAHLGGILGGVLFIRGYVQRGWRFPGSLDPRRLVRRSRPAPRVVRSMHGSAKGSVVVTVTPVAAKPGVASGEDFISDLVDPILDKISQHGIHSLSAEERQILEQARSRMSGRS